MRSEDCSNSLFSSTLPPSCAQFLSTHSTEKPFRKGDGLLDHAAADAAVFVVQDGLLVTEVVEQGALFRPTGFLIKGQGVAPGLVPNSRSPVKLTALTAGAVNTMASGDLRAACQLWPPLALALAENLMAQLDEKNQAHVRRAHMPLALQIGHVYWQLAMQGFDATGNRLLTYKVPQQVLADYLGTSREDVGRKLKQLEAAHLVERTSEGLLLRHTLQEALACFGDAAVPQELPYGAAMALGLKPDRRVGSSPRLGSAEDRRHGTPSAN